MCDIDKNRWLHCRIFNTPALAAGGERNWSAFKYIWSDTRSRLTSSRVHKLVYVYFNQRVLNREQKP
jgi:hypothetical protein